MQQHKFQLPSIVNKLAWISLVILMVTACGGQPTPLQTTANQMAGGLSMPADSLAQMVETQREASLQQTLTGQSTIAATFGPIVVGTPQPATIVAQPNAPTATVAVPTPTEAVDGVETVETIEATLAITATPAIPTDLPKLNSLLMGIQVYANMTQDQWAGLVDRAQFMGFKWLKFQVPWNELETAKGQYSPTFGAIRENMLYAGRRGFNILLSVNHAPAWARPAEVQAIENGPPANPQDLADFITAILDNWGMDYIDAIEVWNEPNLLREWRGKPLTAASYKAYFEAGYTAIRAKSPQIVVLTAAPAPAGDTDGSMNDRSWLQALYNTGLPLSDPNFGIGIHPYGWANAPDARCCTGSGQGWDDQPSFFFLDNIYAYHDIMVKSGHATGKLWTTEFGWSSYDGLHYNDHFRGPAAIPPSDPGLGWMNRISQRQQAEYVIRAFQLAQTGDLAGFMGPMMLWNLNFGTLPGFIQENQPSRPEAGFSVLDMDWNVRLVYEYLQAAPKEGNTYP